MVEPLHAEHAAHEPTVSVFVVRGLVEAAEQGGAHKAAFLREIGWTEERLQRSAARVPLRELFQICEAAVRVTGDAALALHRTERLTQSSFAPISHMLSHVDTLRDVFKLLSTYERLFCDHSFYVLVEEGHTATVRMMPWPIPSLGVRRFVTEMVLAGFAMMISAVSPGTRVSRARFDYAAPAYAAEYKRVLGIEVCFDQTVSEIVFDRARLSVELPHVDRDVYTALTAVAERRLQVESEHAPHTTNLRELMLQRFPKRVSMPEAARGLGLSERSLRRRLEAEGTTFRAVEYSAFASRAKWMLGERKLTVQETAFELGYSDIATFHRAFKRWTGLTPSAYRNSVR